MGTKSRLKRERWEMPAPPTRKIDFIPGLREKRIGDRVVLEKKMSREQHAEFVDAIRRLTIKAPTRLRDLRGRLIAIVGAAPSAELVMRLVWALMPHDPESYRESDSADPAIEVEYPTWLALQLPAPRSAGGPMKPEDVADAVEIVREMSQLTPLPLQYDFLTKGASKPTVEEEVIGFSRVHEFGIRNPGFVLHLDALLRALFTDNGDLERKVGFSIAELLEVVRAVEMNWSDELAKTLTEVRKTSRGTIRGILRRKADADLRAKVPEERRRRMTEQQIRFGGAAMVKSAAEDEVFVRAEELALITPAWLAAKTTVPEATCGRILERFSLGFGQAPIHENLMSRYDPLETRPIMAFPGGRYLPHLQHFWWWGTKPNLEEALKTDADTWDRYERRRARYVEDRSLALFGKMLHGATVEPRLKYRMPDDKGVVQEYELDGLVAYGPVLLLIEGKGARVSHKALRGASATLRQDLKDLMGDAHRQAFRARHYILSANSVTFDRPDRTTLTFKHSDYGEIYLIAVTLQALDVFALRLGLLREMGIIGGGDLPWAVQLLDLEVIADLIEWGPQLIDYLRRRLPLNRKEVMAAEELDFFGTYLRDGLVSTEVVGDNVAMLMSTTNTAPMDDYYHHQWGIRETAAEKPRVRLDDGIRRKVEEAAKLAPADALDAITTLLEEDRERRRSRQPALV